jgi:hypothetical protein
MSLQDLKLFLHFESELANSLSYTAAAIFTKRTEAFYFQLKVHSKTPLECI